MNPLSFKLVNVGNGVANNITITFDSKVFDIWKRKLASLNPDVEYSFSNDPYTEENSYIFVGEDKSVKIDLPTQYLECIAQIIKCMNENNKDSISLPEISMKLTYEGIQVR